MTLEKVGLTVYKKTGLQLLFSSDKFIIPCSDGPLTIENMR